jgi:two-component SAPR family response regulator
MSTVDMVNELGHLHEAGSAEDALAVLKEYSIDILLTDVGLPGMAGTDLARQIRERWPSVRIVFSSGDDSAMSASGIDDALQLPKPFTIDGLAKILSRSAISV